MTFTSVNKILGGALLVAGTCIGAGMLALPVSTGPSGFFPSAMAFILCWATMTVSALYMAEVSLWYGPNTNFFTMTRQTLGRPGALFAFVIYVLFFYALMAAYTIAAAAIIAKYLALNNISESWAIWIVATIFATIVFLGARSVDFANRVMMIGLIVGYFALVGTVLPKVDMELLMGGHPKFLLGVGSLLVTSFGFHLLVPSLKDYLSQHPGDLKWSVIMGSLIPLIVYLFWEVVILGVVPVGTEQGLVAIMQAEHTSGKQAVVELSYLLSVILANKKVMVFAEVFCLCAILTSFIGVALAIFDFFADSFKIKKTSMGKIFLAFLTFFAPVMIALFYPRFLVALHYAGFFAAILLVLYPAIMVWVGRYRLKIQSNYQVMGGKAMVVYIILFGLSMIALEISDRLGWIPSPLNQLNLFQ